MIRLWGQGYKLEKVVEGRTEMENTKNETKTTDNHDKHSKRVHDFSGSVRSSATKPNDIAEENRNDKENHVESGSGSVNSHHVEP
jgi:hypothetical protein